jgi:hypothetical protein
MLTKLAPFRVLSKEFYKALACFHRLAFHRIAARFDPAANSTTPNHPLAGQ